MSGVESLPVPRGWAVVELSAIARINPPLDRCVINDSITVDFVPMRAVEPEGGGLLHPEVATFGKVKKGYTSFLTGDVIMAKITPCMENGKICVVPELPGIACFGSTEFHVLRAEHGVEAKWLASFLVQHSTRQAAQRRMTGGVGQMRVPAAFLESLKLPLPPSGEQRRIADALDELLSDLDEGVTALERARAKLKLYRASVLKAAVEGALTADWRAQHPDAEPASALLERILVERRHRWEAAQLEKFKAADKSPPKNWKAKYKEPLAPNTTNASALPAQWSWSTVEQLAQVASGQTPSGMPISPEADGIITWYRVGDMNASGNETWMTTGGLALTQRTAKALALKVAGPGAIIFPKRGGAIATNKKRRLKFPAACDLNLMIVSPEPAAADYLWLFFQGLDLAKLSDGSNVPQINNPDIVPRIVAFPPSGEQQVIVEVVEEQLSTIDVLEADIDAKLNGAQALRQSILRDAFAGKLVPQDPNDEPASELLKRIAAERKERERLAVAAKRSRATSGKKVGEPKAGVRRKRATSRS